MEGRKWQKGRILTHFLHHCIFFAQIPPFSPSSRRFYAENDLPFSGRRTEGRYSVFLENATATTPGPVCVPITLQMSVESSISTLPCQMSRLSSTYFLR